MEQPTKKPEDATIGDIGNPGPTGSSVGIKAPKTDSPAGVPNRELNEDSRASAPGLGGNGNDRVETIDDVTEGGTSAGNRSAVPGRVSEKRPTKD